MPEAESDTERAACPIASPVATPVADKSTASSGEPNASAPAIPEAVRFTLRTARPSASADTMDAEETATAATGLPIASADAMFPAFVRLTTEATLKATIMPQPAAVCVLLLVKVLFVIVGVPLVKA